MFVFLNILFNTHLRLLVVILSIPLACREKVEEFKLQNFRQYYSSS